MNKERRKKIKEIINQLYSCSSDLEMVKDDEYDALENTAENLKNSDRYQEDEEKYDRLEVAVDDLNSAIENLEEI